MRTHISVPQDLKTVLQNVLYRLTLSNKSFCSHQHQHMRPSSFSNSDERLLISGHFIQLLNWVTCHMIYFIFNYKVNTSYKNFTNMTTINQDGEE